jgi:acyl carrier protein
LYIGGVAVGRGYLDRPELTAERFIRDPFCDCPEARLYKTGDRCRYLPDGNIAFLGRIDTQVKIRGVRIELEEIQATLSQHPRVREAVVAALEDRHGQPQLMAYYVADGDSPPSREELREYLQTRLPAPMIPQQVVKLETIPRLPNGKMDTRAVPDPHNGLPMLDSGFVSPRTESEHELAEIWSRLLNVPRISIHDDFFALGGHSLLAFQLASKIRSRFSIDLPVIQLFESPTLAAMAQIVDRIREADPRAATSRPSQEWDTDTQLDPAITVTGEVEAAAREPQPYPADRSDGIPRGVLAPRAAGANRS